MTRPPTDEDLVEKLSPEDEALLSFFRGLERGSLEAIEAAGRQLIGLVTTLIGLFFGVLAFQDSPAYMGAIEVRLLGVLALIALFASLYFCLQLLLPRRILTNVELGEMRRALSELLAHKSSALTWAARTFGAGVFCLLALTFLLLVRQ